MSNWMVTHKSSDIMHYGIKGMKWKKRKTPIKKQTNIANAAASSRQSSQQLKKIAKNILMSMPKIAEKGSYIFNQYGPGLLLVLANKKYKK
ncbi:MAG: hypothetical protein J6Y02_23580 [Pseudobutyrivibrio sp.]|nr:hypothetical protein [Pseudobutyrivibrio sp.]